MLPRIVVPDTADSKHDALGDEKRTTVSMAYLAQPEQQQQLEWLDGGTLAILLDGQATNGQLMIGRFDVSEGEAPPYHKHTREDEVFMLIEGTALVWCADSLDDLGRTFEMGSDFAAQYDQAQMSRPAMPPT